MTTRGPYATLPVAANGLAQALSAKRVTAGLSIREAAEAANMDMATYWRLECKETMPTVDTFVMAARWLGISLDMAAHLLIGRDMEER